MTLTFDPIAHAYTLDGRPVPSVTQILADVIPGWRASDWHLQRGRAVHACAAMIARGHEFTNDPQIDGQVAACRRFFAEVKPVVAMVETPVASDLYQYAGTLDLLVEWPARGLVLVDFKSTLTPAVPYQLAGYCEALRGQHEVKWGVGVELRADGDYRLSPIYTMRRYVHGWLSLLSAYRIRRECRVASGDTGDDGDKGVK